MQFGEVKGLRKGIKTYGKPRGYDGLKRIILRNGNSWFILVVVVL
jgi:hypothetical protein